MNKQCFKCERVKPLTDFYRHSQMADGHLGKCKACTKSDVRMNYCSNREHFRDYDARRAMAPHRVAARKAYQSQNPDIVARGKMAWQRRNPVKRKAHITLNNALKGGQITHAPRCEVCLKDAKFLQAHHESYEFPLWVLWCCFTCHRNIHKGVIQIGRFHYDRFR